MFILVIEDDPELSEILGDFLSRRGHVVECACNGDAALRSLADAADRPGLILTDLAMPVMDGWGFLRELRRNPTFDSIPVVIMTGYADVSRRAKASGATAVVQKPVDIHTLLQLVDHYSTN